MRAASQICVVSGCGCRARTVTVGSLVRGSSRQCGRTRTGWSGWWPYLRVCDALSPPVPEDTWVGRAVAPALLLLPQLPQQLPPPYGACRSGSVFVVYPSSLRVVQLGVGLTMMQGQNNWKANVINSGRTDWDWQDWQGAARGPGQSAPRKGRRRNTDH